MPTVTKHSSNNLVTVRYPVRRNVLDITHAEHALILSEGSTSHKINMIKFIQSQYNLDEYDAEQVVNTVIEAHAVNIKGSGNEDTAEVDEDDQEIDWSRVPKGTVIYVRDNEYDSWESREFLAYDEYKYYRFICADRTEGSIPWKYAKLGNN